MTVEQNQDPLLPGYSFNAYLVAGLTPIDKGGIYDFFVDRPNGMEGFIINLTFAGEGVIFHEDKSFVSQPGDFLIFPPNESHYYGRRANSKQWYHYWVYFKPRAIWTKWLLWPLTVGNVGYFRSDDQLNKDLENLFLKIVETAQSSNTYSEILAMNLLENFLIQRMQTISIKKQEKYDHRVILACNFISDNVDNCLQDKFIIEHIAELVNLSPSRISHLFKENIGVSILSWREDQRVNKAKFLLQTTPLSISQIAQHLGYTDQFYFSRVFKNKTGLSPKKFRYIFYKN
ncbi:arabinose operon transcriptional regulator AraC [Commensalibacter papalotli (ex Botero et al. 2024)]|uniref:arabinose operon transcriptional regulator AraC n=1 Tax=Commensalibacter papalotli (ex Botero et al. 2024) TaxID=2972766 RepID=UPI0022FF6243|nr:arabinose operon transcriptional regulator AraC [Commensalibacter papalotli (ex Botero et al. 2024)]CAI3954486.1 AraC-type DNA-binding domain and AraC-containing proteins (AraC) (PDB:1BL0) [Commensalibacter papalotli (ex Botero et al. 2024)]